MSLRRYPACATACGSKVRWVEDRLRVPHPSAPARAPVARSWKSGGFVHAFGACTGKDEETAAGLKPGAPLKAQQIPRGKSALGMTAGCRGDGLRRQGIGRVR